MASMQATHSTPRAGARTVGDERLACGDDAALTKEVDDGSTDDDHGDVDRGARGIARTRALRRKDRTPPRGPARPCHGRPDRGGLDARSGAARSGDPCRSDPRPDTTPPGATAREAGRRRSALADYEPALHAPDTARRPVPARTHRLHGGRIVHVHAAKAAAPRARPCPRPSEPDRPVAAVAPRRCGADADRRLGVL